jgi:hypothetical protein
MRMPTVSRRAAMLVAGAGWSLMLAGCARHGADAYLKALQRFNRLPEAQRRALLHRDLQVASDPHDVYIDLIGLADETSVPLLLERLRRDYGAAGPPQPAPPRALPATPTAFPLPAMVDATANSYVAGFVCTQAHLIEALESATNASRGMYYPAWHAWWEANRTQPRHQWIRDGFAAMEMHVVIPVDERFGIELLSFLPRDGDGRVINAVRLLHDVPTDTLAGWIEQMASSTSASLRRGAAASLRFFDIPARVRLLRALAADADDRVATTARQILMRLPAYPLHRSHW